MSLIKKCLFGVLGVIATLSGAFAQTNRTVYIDAVGGDAPATWNNLSFSGANSAELKDNQLLLTGIQAKVITPLHPGANANGSTNPTGAAAEFKPAGANNAYGHSLLAWESIPPIIYGEMVFSNLNVLVAYSFTFYASRVSSSDNRETLYTTTGSNTVAVALNAANNSTLVAVAANVYPAANGTIKLRIDRGPNNTNTYGFFYLTALKIVYDDPGSPVIPPVEPIQTFSKILIDTGSATATSGWNNLPFTATTSAVPLVDSTNATTRIKMQITTALGAIYSSTAVTFTGDAAEFQPVGNNGSFGYNTAYATPAKLLGTAVFSGLNTNAAYHFTFFALRSAVVDNRSALYALSGANSASNTLNASANTSQVALVTNILPNADGTITLSITKAAANNNASGFFYISGIKITMSAQSPSVPVDPPAQGEAAKRLLFFGNSFSMGEDVPAHVGSIAALAGHPAPLVVSDLLGGTDLAYHIGQVDSYPENNVTNAALVGTNTWDWVVMQGYSTEATHLRDPNVFKANGLALYQRVKNHVSGKGAGVNPLLFQTWARAPGHSFYPGSFANPAAMQLEIRTNYQAAAQIIQAAEPAADVRVAPVGDSFELDGFDPTDLYSSDLYHAGNLGPELAALIIYKTLYETTVTNIPYATVSAAGWTSMSSNDWVRVTYWAEGLTPPDEEPEPPTPAPPTFGGKDVYLLDAAGTPAASGNTWNSLNFYTAAASTSLLTTNGLSKGATCTVVTRMNAGNSNGSPSPTGAAAIFLPAGFSASYGNTVLFNGYTAPYAVVRFGNLSRSSSYSFTFYGSRIDGAATDNRETLYTVTGSTTSSAVLNCLNNSTQVATVADIEPATDRTITLRLEPGPNNTNTSGFYYISALKIESVSRATWISVW